MKAKLQLAKGIFGRWQLSTPSIR